MASNMIDHFEPVKGYYSTKDLTARFRCSSRTIHRWMKRENNPFPNPRITGSGSQNLWAIDDVEIWEKEIQENAA